MARYVKPSRYAMLTGYTVKAIERKIEKRVWLEGHEYRKAPDGLILVDIEGVERWVEGRRRAG